MKTTINCQEVALRIGAAPNEKDQAVSEHLEQCAQCSSLHSQLSSFDQVLQNALDVDVPANLGSHVFDEQTDTIEQDSNVVPLSAKQRKNTDNQPRNYRSMAIAASLVLGIGLILGGVIGRVTAPIPEALVAHVEHEQQALGNTWSVVPVSTVQQVLNSGGVSLNGDIGEVRYAKLCYFRGNKVPHVVVNTESGPVTLMLLPDVSVDGPTSFSEEGYEGLLLPVGKGSVGIIGDEREAVIKVREQVKDKVSWRI